MHSKCPECHGSITWDDSVGSAVCTSCGTLTDPSQSVLTSQYEFFDGTAAYSGAWDPIIGKRARFSSSWTLSDQAKEARDERNFSATTHFIESLARSLNATGLSPRAINLFRRVKEAIQFRWGRKAKLIAGACLGVALRQSNRPDCLQDIAYLLEEPFSVVSKAFISVTSALDLTLSRTDAGTHIPILQQHLSSLVQSTLGSLSATLLRELSRVSLHTAGNTANSLSNLLARIGTPSITQYSAAPTACAIFMISLESELRGALKQLGPVAEILAARLNTGKGTVMSCYKDIQDTLVSLVENLPWLDKYETKEGRAKIAKRSVVARAAEDIIGFYDDSWKKIKPPVLDIDYEEPLSQQQTMSEGSIDEDYTIPRKKRKTQHMGHQAIQFLLDPLMVSVPKIIPSMPKDATGVHKSSPSKINHPLASYFLSANATSTQPSRLQLLAAQRGGADAISDDELFEDGELENLMRSELEMKVILDVYGWGKDGVDALSAEPQVEPSIDTASYQKTIHQDNSQPKGKRNRINLEALARLLNDDDSQNDESYTGLLGVESDDSVGEFESRMDKVQEEAPQPGNNQFSYPELSSAPSDEIIIGGWRPPSPENGISNERYDEVYD